jgi:hypothetical protein
MTMLTDAPQKRYITRHVTYRLPVIGRMAREVVEGDEDNALYAVVGGIALWLCAILIFGYPGLIVPALGLTAAMFVALIRITLG